jgi:hypothetical protein
MAFMSPTSKSGLILANPWKSSISRRQSCKLFSNLQFVNAGLRGHQFVKEGAEEVLELRALLIVKLPFSVRGFESLKRSLSAPLDWEAGF